MNKVDIVKQVFSAIESGDFNRVKTYATEDMVFDGPVPEPIHRDEFINLQKALGAGIPDWRFNAKDFRESGNKVLVTVHITGTHSRTLMLPMIPHPVDATGKQIRLPEEHLEISFTGDKINRVHSDTVKGGGVMGILDQLGVKVMAH